MSRVNYLKLRHRCCKIYIDRNPLVLQGDSTFNKMWCTTIYNHKYGFYRSTSIDCKSLRQAIHATKYGIDRNRRNYDPRKLNLRATVVRK